MLDQTTFLITLYVLVDDFCRHHLPAPAALPGPDPALSRSEVICLSLFGQWARFASERDFWRFAHQRLRPLFPILPHLSQFNRLQRLHQEAILALSQHLVELLDAQNCAFEVLDRCGIATRWCGRRGVGHLPEDTNKGYCSRLGYFEGFHLLSCVNPQGVLTGFALGAASAKDQPLAQAFFEARQEQLPQAPCVGRPCRSGQYVTDCGFEGKANHQRWWQAFQVEVIHPPKRGTAGYHTFPKSWRRWLVGLRQIVESVHHHLLNTFRLERERPHELRGFFARLSAKVALHNFCIWLNRSRGRPNLQFADLLAWN